MKSSTHTVRMSAGARQFLGSHIEAEREDDVMLPALQMSVKVSGHLITIRAWKGKLAFVAKNSAENEYTLAAQLVLDQMLGREAIVRLIKAMEGANICLSFECITSFNGDHGYPQRSAVDVMLCTAIHKITELGPSDPWTYISVFAFCRSHGLPCTQCLYALDEVSAVSAFDAYRGMCHQFGPHTTQLESMFDTFSAQHMCVVLESFSHAYISPVVEGFVVCSTMLSREEIQILLESQKEGPVPMDLDRLLCQNLRRTVNDISGPLLEYEHALKLWKRTCEEGRGFPVVRLHRVGRLVNLEQCLGGGKKLPIANSEVTNPKSRGKGNMSSGRAMLMDLLRPSDTSVGVASKDTQTQYVLSVLRTCMKLGIKVSVSFYSTTTIVEENKEEESSWLKVEDDLGGDNELHLAILHVVYDAHHFKFHRHAAAELSESQDHSTPLVLYRGFVVRLMKTVVTNEASAGKGTIKAEVFANFYPKFDNATQQDNTKMISDLWEKRQGGEIRKFKFSYYMYATMLCRSLLEVGKIASHPKNMSIQLWELKCKTTITKWGMKSKDQVPYLLRLLSWHVYVQHNRKTDPPMCSSTYLTHFCRFLDEESSWHQHVQRRMKRINIISRAIYVIAPVHHFRCYKPGSKKTITTTYAVDNDTTNVVAVPSSSITMSYADYLAEKLGVEWVGLTGRQGYTEESIVKKRNQPKHKKNKHQKNNGNNSNEDGSDGYIDHQFIDKVFAVGKVVAVGDVVKKKCVDGGIIAQEEERSVENLNARSCSETVNQLVPTCSNEGGDSSKVNSVKANNIAILPLNGKVTDEAVAIVDFNAINTLPEGNAKVKLNRWVKMFQECTTEVWDMHQCHPWTVADSLLEMESQVVQPILIFPCGIPGSGKSTFGQFLSKYGVKMVCSDDKLAPKKNKRQYDAIIERSLKPFTVRQRHSSHRTSELAAAAAGEGKGTAEEKQLRGIQHFEAEHQQDHNKEDGAMNMSTTTVQPPRLPAVYRDKNASSNQYADIIRSVSHTTRVVAVVFGTSVDQGGVDRTKLPPMTDWEIVVCMRRTLMRQNHEGDLDATQCMTLRIVLGFAMRFIGSFRTKGAFMEHMKLLCGEDNVLSVPICMPAQFRRKVPRVVKKLLNEGQNCRKALKLSDDWEQRLRDALESHDDEIKSMDAEPNNHFFRTAITDTISALLDIADEGNANVGISDSLQNDDGVNDSASLFEATLQHMVTVSCLSEALRNNKVSENEGFEVNGVKSSSKHISNAQKRSSGGSRPLRGRSRYLYQVSINQKEFIQSVLLLVPELSDWLKKQSLPLPTTSDDNINNNGYHVTLAFLKRDDKHASPEYIAVLDRLVGTCVQVHVNSCACDGKAAALIVCDMDPSSIQSLNRVAHLTLRTKTDIPSRHSNDMLESGNYNELKFKHAISFSGIVTSHH